MWYDLPYLQLQVALCVCCHVKLGATQSPFVASMKPLLLHIPQSKGGAALRQHLSRDALDAAEALGLWSCFGSAGVAESLGKATGEARTEQLEKKLSQLLRIIPAAGCLVLGALFFFSKVCCQKLDNGLGRSMKATKTRVEARVCKQNYTRGIQQHIYPIVLIEFESWGWGGKSVVDCCFILHNLSPMTKV